MSEEIAANIRQYEEQLHQVDEFLISDPNNSQFLSLRDDLVSAINSIKNLLQQVDNNDDLDTADNKHDDNEESDDENVFMKAPVIISTNKTEKLRPGEIIEVYSNERPFAGVILRIIDDNSCVVKYFEHEAEVTLPIDSLQRIALQVEKRSISAADVAVGLRCLCKYSADQLYYDAEVIEITSHGVIVKYLQYGNTEEVPLQYLRRKKAKEGEEKNDGKKIIEISEKLKILPTDTEEVRRIILTKSCCEVWVWVQEKLRKKKRIKAIKSHNRAITKEVEMEKTQNSWKSFVNKVHTHISICLI